MTKKYSKIGKNFNKIQDFDKEVVLSGDFSEGVLFSLEELEENLGLRSTDIASNLEDFSPVASANKDFSVYQEQSDKSKNQSSNFEPLLRLEDLDQITQNSPKKTFKPIKFNFALFKQIFKNFTKIFILAGVSWLILTAPVQLVRLQYFFDNLNGSSVAELTSAKVANKSFVYAISTALAQNPYNSDDLAYELRTLKNKPAGLAENYLVIPKTKVSAPVVWNSPSDEASVMKNLRDGVVHYDFTHTPNSESGNVFINGHSSYYPWDSGKHKTVFALLNKLEKGDRAYIQYEGKIFVYEMTDAVIVSPDKVEIAGASDKPILSLMTCDPVGTFLNRLVVQFDLVGVYKA